jgi:hypothetical protein
MVYRLDKDGTDPAAIARLQAFLDLRKATLSRIRGLFVYGEDGRWLLTTEKINLVGLNNSDRNYFQRHRESADLNTLIGQPVRSKSGGQWIVTLSRRYNHPDGSFAGVALMTIDVAYFSQFYAQFDVVQMAPSRSLARTALSLRVAPTMAATLDATWAPRLFLEIPGSPPGRTSLHRVLMTCSGSASTNGVIAIQT